MKSLILLLAFQLISSSPISDIATPKVVKSSEEIKLVTFDDSDGTTFKFYTQNDAIMGGVSTATFEVNEEEKVGIFNGTVKIVPSLNAPGFCSMQASGKFNDASSTIDGGITLRVRTSTPNYAGFRMVFQGGALSPGYSCGFGGTVPFSNGCYKALFKVPPGDEFVDVTVPFTDFSDHWDPETGNHFIECSDDPKVCPTARALEKIKEISIMGEGVQGDFHLEIESISATI